MSIFLNLLQYNIDEDRVRDEISEFYDYDVRENHDVYLDEEDRELSDKQQEEISLLKRKIAQTEELISNLDDLLNDESNQPSALPAFRGDHETMNYPEVKSTATNKAKSLMNSLLKFYLSLSIFISIRLELAGHRPE